VINPLTRMLEGLRALVNRTEFASYVPAQRAARVQPMDALRHS
jgi:hypothetical protein